MIRIAICEDVLHESQRLEHIVCTIMNKLCSNARVFVFQSGEELLCEIDTTGSMDIIFMDVEMPGINGIETARFIREKDTRAVIIFMSCHTQYYREMLDVQPYAFLDKPVSAERTEEILEQVMKKRMNFCDRYAFSYHKRQYTIPLMHIRYFQSDKRIVRVHTVHEDPLPVEYLFYGKLEEVERSLEDSNIKFLRVRKSFLVNTQFIIQYSIDQVTLDNGVTLEIGKNYKSRIREYYFALMRTR